MRFNYLARTKDGQSQKGIVEASSEEAALLILQKYGLFVTALERVGSAPIYAKQVKFLQRVSGKDIVVFTRQLAIMFKSQVPIIESLLVIARQSDNPDFKEKIIKLSNEVEGGTPLSGAFSLYPKLFSTFYISMVKSGEASGKLSETLEYLADHLEKEFDFKGKVKGAMIYPALILAVFIFVFIFMIYWVLPPLLDIVKEAGQELPLTTKIIISVSDFIKKWGWAVGLAFAGFLALAFYYKRTPNGKDFFDRNILKLPILKNVFKKTYLSRFAENLSTLIAAGIPIATALEISGEVVGNNVYRTIILRVREEVRRGENISSVLENYPVEFPPLFTQMIVVGEKTGRTDAALGNIVNFYQKEVDRGIDNLISLLEPAMMILLGGGVAFLLVSVLLPIYQMGNF